ncbi:undecaprenyl-diphosphatase UppP [Pseudobdellovibrio sp. HCB154]|uniref:undecaprenyl-diphosphatase UppP n=1 Tax=Pseudobdellovibrio sp. HCB154 TaxID=3386277 RepID=UPI0039170E11
MSYLHVVILALVEGLTEFLPISSTGHLILTSHFLGLTSDDFLKAFQIIIQFGAIMAVVVMYWKRFLKVDINFYKKIAFGSFPVLLAGFLLKDVIDQWLDSTVIVAWSLVIGGIVFVLADMYIKPTQGKHDISVLDSVKIGLIQCIALIPGISRSGATILGAQTLRYEKTSAAEFSFFLAVPTLTAATLYKAWKIRHIIDSTNAPHLIVGIILSFIFAWLAIKGFIAFVSRHGFKWFGFYRIVLGLLVLIYGR